MTTRFIIKFEVLNEKHSALAWEVILKIMPEIEKYTDKHNAASLRDSSFQVEIVKHKNKSRLGVDIMEDVTKKSGILDRPDPQFLIDLIYL